MRNLQKSTPLKDALKRNHLSASLIECDVTNTQSVNDAIQQIITEQGKIDCLINNAGIGFIKTTEQADESEIDQVMNTNYMGVVRTTKAVLPHMRKARSGHIINVSSVGGLVGQPFNEIYCASKFALEGYTESLASYVKPFFNIKFSLVEPGGIQSEFISNVMANHDTDNLDDEYKPILGQYVQGAQNRASDEKSQSAYQTSSEVAQCIIDVINNPEPPLRVRTSPWAENFCQLKTKSDPQGILSVNKVYSTFLQHNNATGETSSVT